MSAAFTEAPAAAAAGIEAPPRFVVTGRGVVSAIGNGIEAFNASLAQARGGITGHDTLVAGEHILAGLAVPFTPHAALCDADRNAQLAGEAAGQALREAGLLDPEGRVRQAPRVALLMGTSHGGRSQLDAFAQASRPGTADDSAPPAPSAADARSLLERAAHHHQAARVARLFGIAGPVLTFSTACSSSGSAVAHALELLRHGRADAVVAGGADAFSRLTWAGFRALGAIAEAPCGPFGETIGMTLGEGAAFLVIECERHADARGAAVHGRLHGCGSSWDAHHLTAPEPSGRGMARAIADALSLAGLAPADIDYVNAHATGTRANDVAETFALKAAFGVGAVPPISATKSFTGHTLGASSVMGYLAALSATTSGLLPPTLNHAAARAGCDLDCLSGPPRRATVRHFLAQSAAFGGANCVLAGGAADAAAGPGAAPFDEVVLTGLGVVSPLGCDTTSFFEALARQARPADGLAQPEPPAGLAALRGVLGFEPRRQLPPGPAARLDRISQYAIAAAQQALAQAGWGAAHQRPARTGLMVALCRGAAASFEGYLHSVRGGQWSQASALYFPNLVMSSVGGKAAMVLGLKGPASTVVGSDEVGLALLGQAADLLRSRDDLDALVVVAADESCALYRRLEAARRGPRPAPPLAEGAAAVVLERGARAQARGAAVLARVAGSAQSFGEGAAGLARALTGARAGAAAAWGLQSSPHRAGEAAGGAPVSGSRLVEAAGHAEASGGLWAVVAAVRALGAGATAAEPLAHTLACSGLQSGAHALLRPLAGGEAGGGVLLHAVGETGACAALLLQ